MDAQALPQVPEWVHFVQQGIDDISSIPQLKAQYLKSENDRRNDQELARQQRRADLEDREAFNAKFDALIANVNAMSGDITAIKGDITAIKCDITAIKGDITAIKGATGMKGDITGMKGDITAIKADIACSKKIETEERIRRSNRVVGSVNKISPNTDWIPLKAVIEKGEWVQGDPVDIKRSTDINSASK